MIFVAFVFSSLVYLLIGFILSGSGWSAGPAASSLDRVMFPLFTAITVIIVAVVAKLRLSAFSPEMPRPENLEQLQRYVISRFVILLALSEAPAILGLVYFLLCGKFLHLVFFCVLSCLSFAIVRPSRVQLEELQQRYGF